MALLLAPALNVSVASESALVVSVSPALTELALKAAAAFVPVFKVLVFNGPAWSAAALSIKALASGPKSLEMAPSSKPMERAKSARLFSLGASLEAVTIWVLSPSATVLRGLLPVLAKALAPAAAPGSLTSADAAVLALDAVLETLGSRC